MGMFHIEETVVSAFVEQEETAHVFDSHFQVPSLWQWTWLGRLHQDVTRIWDKQDTSW